MDDAQLKQLAMPRETTTLSAQRASRANALAANGYTYAEIAKQLGVSSTTINRYINQG